MSAAPISPAKWPADVAVPVLPVPDRNAIAARYAVAPTPLVDTTGRFFARPEWLTDWAIEAEEGLRCIYARGTGFVYQVGLREHAQKLARLGVIEICAKRHELGDGMFDYIARRTAGEWRTEEPTPPPPERQPAELTPAAMRVLDLVVRRADEGAPLDSNRGIANATGLKDADAAAYQLRVLRERGLILLAPVPVDPGRIATIVESGAQTGMIGR